MTCITIQYIIYIILQQNVILTYKTISKHCKTNLNGPHLFSAFLTIDHPIRFTLLPHIHHSRTHSHTDGGVSHARRQPARRELTVRVRCLAQGHLDTQLGGAGDRTNNLQVTSQPALPHTHTHTNRST